MARVLWKHRTRNRYYEVSVGTQFLVGLEYDEGEGSVCLGPFEFWTHTR